LTRRWRGLVLPVALVIVSEIPFHVWAIDADALAPPSAVLSSAYTAIGDGTLFTASLQTLEATMGGLIFGGVAALIFGVLLGTMPRLARLSVFSIEVLRPIPAIALIPLAMLIFGFGLRMEMSIIAIAVFWPVLILTESAVGSILREQLEVARLLQLNGLETFSKIILPAIGPRLFNALRLALGLALVVAVTVEIFGNPQGLGYAISIAQQSLDPALSLAMLVWVGCLGWALGLGLMRLQGLLFPYLTQVET
jgi:ABC-type nitrate/sulfonate/bicarbonate transport system permease component